MVQYAQLLELLGLFGFTCAQGRIDQQELLAVGIQADMLQRRAAGSSGEGNRCAAEIQGVALVIADNLDDVWVIKGVFILDRMRQCRHGKKRFLPEGLDNCPDGSRID